MRGASYRPGLRDAAAVSATEKSSHLSLWRMYPKHYGAKEDSYVGIDGPFLDDSTSKLSRAGRIRTSSWLYKFWLSTFRGYRVERSMQTPKGYSLGRLTYSRSWILKRKDAK